jgi:hypothetical protein
MILIPTTLTIATIGIIWYHLTGNKRWLKYKRLQIAWKMVMNDLGYRHIGKYRFVMPPPELLRVPSIRRDY